MKNLILAVSGVAVVAGASAFYANPAEAQQRGPRGSYAQSCPDSEVRSGRLYARCYDRSGQLQGSSIEVSRCNNQDIGNINGMLMCGDTRGRFENLVDNNRRDDRNDRGHGGDRRGGYGGSQGGSFGDRGYGGRGNDYGNDRRGGYGGSVGSITVYRDAQFRGTSRTFDGSIRNLSEYGLNDAISSIRLSRGTWEVCEHADFRGRCETIRGDVRDLTRMNLNDKVSSLRPVGRR
jgi:hypothetical protein